MKIDKRRPLKVLAMFILGAGSTIALMSGTNAHAFSLSPEEIIEKFMDAIVQYVAGNALKVFTKTIQDWQKKIKDLYGGESEDVAKKGIAAGVGVNKSISVEEKIYNDNAMSDAMEIKTACRKSPGPVIEQAKKQLSTANEEMQASAIHTSIEQNKRKTLQQRAAKTVDELKVNIEQLKSTQSNAAIESPDKPAVSTKIPSALDATFFIKDEGYINSEEAAKALNFIKSITEYRRSTIVASTMRQSALSPTDNEALSDDIGRMADVMNATAVLNDIYLSRVRDKTLAQSVIDRTTDGEASILRIHANDAGMSLVDVYNFEAEAAAFNHEYIKDIMTAKVDDNQENESVIPSAVRGYKYIVQMKALENAFSVRLHEQYASIMKLNAILTKQKLRENINGGVR